MLILSQYKGMAASVAAEGSAGHAETSGFACEAVWVPVER
jgi:hypothetical protein